MKITKAQRTKAVARFARRYGFYARTVRNITALRYRAVWEYATEILKIDWPMPAGVGAEGFTGNRRTIAQSRKGNVK